MKKSRKVFLSMALALLMSLASTTAVFADTGLSDGTYSITADTGEKMFRVVDACLTVEDGNMTALITLSGTGYGYLYSGKVGADNTDPLDTVDASERIAPSATVKGDDGGDQYQYEIPVAALDTALDFGAFSNNKQVWYARTLTFDSASAAIIADDGSTSEEGESDASAGDADTENPKDEDAPKTGDTSDIAVYVLIAAFSMAAAVAICKKKKA